MTLEIIMTIIVIIEIIARIATQQKDFFASCWNIVDLFTILLIVGLYVAFEIVEAKNGGDEKSNKTYLAVLLAVRYVVQIVRILITMEESREMRKEADSGFDILAESEESQKDDTLKLTTKMTILVDDRYQKFEDEEAPQNQ